jgi:hypothetical protein
MSEETTGVLSRGYRSLFGRALKVGAPATGLAGALADLGAPMGALTLWFALVCLVMAVGSGVVWFLVRQARYRRAMADGQITPAEFEEIVHTNPWSVMFAFGCVGTLVLGTICVAQQLVAKPDDNGPDRGVIATLIPAAQKMQNSLFRIEEQVVAIKRDTEKIRETTDKIAGDTTKIAASQEKSLATQERVASGTEQLLAGQEKVVGGQTQLVEGQKQLVSAAAESKAATEKMASSQEKMAQSQEKMAKSLADMSEVFAGVAKSGGLIASPSNAAEHYHNARVHEMNGNFAGARQSYNEYLKSGLDYIDPWLNYTLLLKAQDGLEGARDTLELLSRSQKTASLRAAQSLVQPKEKRVAELEKVTKEFPDYAPAQYLLAGEFSEEKLGQQTLSDKRREKTALEAFTALDKAGKFQKFVLDKKEAAKWQESAASRLAKLAAISAEMLKNPFTVNVMQSNQGTMLTFILTEFTAQDIFYRMDGEGEFKSTGKQTTADPSTGKPRPNMTVTLENLAPGPHRVEVKYVDASGAEQGPYEREFDPVNEQAKMMKHVLENMGGWVEWRDFDGKMLVYFTHLVSSRAGLKKIAYRFNENGVEKEFPLPALKPGASGYEIPEGATLSLTAPKDATDVRVKLTWYDGTESAEKVVPRPAK